MTKMPLVAAAFALAFAAFAALAQTAPTAPTTAVTPGSAPAGAAKPTLWLIGDSTVNNNANGGLGWGAANAIGKLFDPNKITVKNNARGGRSARSYYSEGLWDAVKNNLKEGDYVLMQFGTNDGPGSNAQIASSTNGRPDLAGIGEETTTGTASTGGKQETVHTFGWYMDIYVKDTQAKKATAIMLNPVPHNIWLPDGTMRRAYLNSFDKWSSDIALKNNTYYINLDEICATRLDKEGKDTVTTKYFTPPGDGTHTNPAGAQFNSESVVMGIRALKDFKLNDYLSDAGKKLDPADVKNVRAPGAATASAPATAP